MSEGWLALVDLALWGLFCLIPLAIGVSIWTDLRRKYPARSGLLGVVESLGEEIVVVVTGRRRRRD